MAVGKDVSTFEVGDRSLGTTRGQFGAHAEFLSIAETGSLAMVPAHLTFEQVAPSTDGSHYALAQIRAAGIRSGQHVLVHGATGAIGSAAVQLVKSLGAHVTAVCPRHTELVRSLGSRPGHRLHGRGLHRG